jgi:eukaryotic-like serine/threonine-protein kinase
MAAKSLDEQAIFEVARKIDPGEAREAYLQQSCDDAVIGRRVRALLKAFEESASFLESPAAPFVATLDEPIRESPGTVVGHYKLLEQIGEGGMSLVFVAEQQRPVKRRVALKVIKPGMDSRQVLARFEAERQALALMDHPNIAKVHDGGTTEGGRPYFVMELVKGKPITDYADTHRLTTRQRLELFLDVCHAVQHAHQKGIIHRDLKPSNVLVSLHDVRAVVKVIDFGVAKATGARLTDQSIYTGIAQMIGTPHYMSPEQAGLSDLDVDTRSDVYALGVLLYELLTGTTPFESETLKKVGLDEMRRIIREDEPPQPSTRLSTMQQAALSTIEEKRSVEPRRLSQVLRGELDWIVMKALEKDRNRRYESASAFAADVQRYLNDEAVAACPPSASYRLRKFTRRNRRSIVTAGVIAVALVAATLVSAWQAVVARDAQHQAEADRKQAEADRNQAEADRDRAKSAERQAKTDQDRAKTAERRAATEAAIARAVNDFLQGDLLGQAHELSEASGGNPYLTVKEALDRAADRIGERFQDQPLVEAAIRMAIGAAYDRLFERQLALPHLERALKLRKAHLDPGHPDTLGCMQRLAAVYMWVGRHPDAIALRQHLLESRKALVGLDHPDSLGCMSALAESYLWAGQLDTSARLYEQLLEKQRAHFGPTHPTAFETMRNLARIYGLMGRHSEAMAQMADLLALRKATFGPQDFPYSDIFVFTEVCHWAGKHDQADRLLRELLERDRKSKDSLANRNGMANTLGSLALNRLMQGKYDEAETLVREAVPLSHIGDMHHFYWLSVLGAALLGQQKFTEAEPLLLKGYEGMKQREGIHPAVRKRVSEAAGWIGDYYEATNQPEKARAWREKAKPKLPDTPSDGVK